MKPADFNELNIETINYIGYFDNRNLFYTQTYLIIDEKIDFLIYFNYLANDILCNICICDINYNPIIKFDIFILIKTKDNFYDYIANKVEEFETFLKSKKTDIFSSDECSKKIFNLILKKNRKRKIELLK